ncbi:ABC transporter permease [Piscibacillus halophilus]|uniref:ABC-2 type transport system permease protein n=1 Tax=Piscibacillus halophilus TaxID=571933 RepID=A0A1H9GJP5_9BACI|nr:ABC transporter [Piscibacillus halophilus]SEQ50297.1 ABC-2 type transport system permease protein [Piscibacillus halophilus]
MKQLWHLINANLRKEYIELKRYFPNTITMILQFYFIFLAMLLGIHVIGDPQQVETNVQYVIVNYVIWFFMLTILQSLGFVILFEAQRGTLEQLFMTPLGMWRVLFGRIISNLLIFGILVTVLLVLSMLTAGEWLVFRIDVVLPVFLITTIGVIGVGYMLSGLAIIFKQIQSVLNVLQFILMGLAFVPLSVAPYLVFAPFVKGIDMIRLVMIHSYTWNDFTALDYSALILNSIFYLVFGIFIYLKSERFAMERGLLSQY